MTTDSKKLLTLVQIGHIERAAGLVPRSDNSEAITALCHAARIAHEQEEMIQQLAEDRSKAVEHLDRAMPWSTTFLFSEPGCEAVGQATPLAKAIESAMKAAFERWEQSWIRPCVEPLAAVAPFLRPHGPSSTGGG